MPERTDDKPVFMIYNSLPIADNFNEDMTLKYWIIAVLFLLCNGLAFAQEETLPRFSDLRINFPSDTDYIQLAAKDNPAQMEVNKDLLKGEEAYEDRWFTANKIHQYLGIGSLAMAVLAAIVPKPPKDNLDDGMHRDLANASAALGGAALTTGLIFHYDDIFDNGFTDPDNLHALYTTLGVLGYALAIDEAPEAQHAGYGALGALFMTIGIKMTW